MKYNNLIVSLLLYVNIFLDLFVGFKCGVFIQRKDFRSVDSDSVHTIYLYMYIDYTYEYTSVCTFLM